MPRILFLSGCTTVTPCEKRSSESCILRVYIHQSMQQSRSITFLVFLGLVLSVPRAVAQKNASPAERQLFDPVNRERSAKGLPTLRWNPALADAARRHAQLLAENKSLSHQFSGEPSLPARATKAGVHFTTIAENVAEAPSAADIHSLWMHSPHHRANILDRDLDSIGIAVSQRNVASGECAF